MGVDQIAEGFQRVVASNEARCRSRPPRDRRGRIRRLLRGSERNQLPMISIVAAALALATPHTNIPAPLPARTAETIVATWRCQDKLPVARTHAYSPWKPHSRAF